MSRAKRRLILNAWEAHWFEKAGFTEGRDYVIQERKMQELEPCPVCQSQAKLELGVNDYN